MARTTRLVVPDIWRALAVIAMVLYHFLFIGWYGFSWDTNPTIGLWRGIGRLSGWSFLFVAGWSAWLLIASGKALNTQLRQKLFKRLGTLAAFAAFISIVTLIFVPRAPIWWGILHAMTASLAITYVLLWKRQGGALKVLGWLTIFVGLFLTIIPGNWLTLPFGWPPFAFRSLDYYPLAPYAGLVWLGAAYGEELMESTAWLEVRLQTSWPGKRVLLWIGQHSLAIYLLHVPLLWITLGTLSLI